MRSFTTREIVATLLLLGALGESALGKTEGSLSGSVVDVSGGVLPGVIVTVSSPELLGGSRTATSDVAGLYRFPALPPGVYTITAELLGFQKLSREGIQIQINQPASYDVVLAMESQPGMTMEMVVVAHESVVQPEKTQVSTALNNEFVDNIPVLGRAYQSLLLLAPGVVNRDGLGSGLNSANVNSHGARADANQYLFDGGNTTDSSLGTFGNNFNQDAVEQIEVITAGYRAEYGRSDGLISNVLTKSGGNAFEGSLRVDLRDSALDKRGSGKRHLEELDFSRRIWSATLGGPFVKDRFWFFASAYWNDSRDVDTFEGGPYPVATSDSDFHDYFFKASLQITDDHQLVASYHMDPATIHATNAGGFTPPSYYSQQEQGGTFYLLKESAVFTPNVLLESLVFVTNDNRIEVGPDEDAPPSSSPWDGRESTTSENVGRFPSRTDIIRDRNQFREDLSVYVDDAAGNHDLKFGVGYELELMSEDDTSLPFYILRDGVPFRKTVPLTGVTEPATSAHSRNYSAYAQDSWQPRDGLTVNLGLRADLQQLEFNGFVNDDAIVTDPTLGYRDMQRGIQEIQNVGVAPRLGFSWDPGSDGTDVVRGSAARFYTTLPGDVGEWERYSWAYGTFTCQTDANGNCLDEAEAADFWLVTDPDTSFPYTDELSLGYEREVMPELALGVQGIYRKGHDILQDVDINSVYADTNGDGVPDERTLLNPNFDGAIYYMGNFNKTEYKGVELTARKRLAESWQLLASYTYSVAKGDGNYHRSADGDDPRLIPLSFTYSDFDQRHVVKVDGTYFLPMDFIVSASARYFTGTPYSRTGPLFVDADGDGIPDPDEVVGGSANGITYFGGKNSRRNDSYANLDLRGEKDFVWKGATLGVFGDVFNVFNNHAVVETEERVLADGTGGVARTETKRFGRRYQLGLRISF